MNDLLQRYADLKIQEKKIADAIKALQPEVISSVNEAIQAQGETKGQISTDFGTFTLTQLRKYTYPAYVTDAEARYKQLKTDAEAKGDATYVDNPSVKFTQLKQSNEEEN